METGNGLTYQHPQLPARNVATSTMIKVEARDQRATTPSGSHRVLLKLKKISASAAAANRPKSLHEADLDSNEASTDSSSRSTTAKRLPTSRSSHQFYNRTWNERSLTKYANQHNYENVYSEQEDGHTGQMLINQLTCSPRSARSSRALWPDDPGVPQPDHEVPPVPPERKGRGRRRGCNGQQSECGDRSSVGTSEPQRITKPLFRSKSCERPKMRDTFRMEKFAANFNRISSNITDKIIAAKSNSAANQQRMSTSATSPHLATIGDMNGGGGEIVAHNGNSLLQTVAFRAIPCVDIQVGKNLLYSPPINFFKSKRGTYQTLLRIYVLFKTPPFWHNRSRDQWWYFKSVSLQFPSSRF